MGILLHFHFDSSFEDIGSRTAIERAFLPVLSAIEFACEKNNSELRCAVSGSGLFVSRLGDADCRFLRSLISRERAEVLLTPYALPAPEFASAFDIQQQLELNRDEWKRLGIAATNSVWLPAPLPTAAAAALTGFRPSLVIAAGSLRCEEIPGCISSLEDGCPWVFSHTERGDLGKRSAARAPFSFRSYDGQAVTISFSSEDAFAETISEIDCRTAFLDLLKDLRGEFSKLARSVANFVAEFPESEMRDPGEALRSFPSDVPPSSGERAWALKRVEQLGAELAPLRDFIKTQPKEIENLERLTKARKALALSRSNLLWRDSAFAQPFNRARIFEQINIAQVEIDAIRDPETDPVLGWVRSQELPERGPQIDTQLMRLYFDLESGGALAEFDYKPRKVNLVSTNWGMNDATSFVEGLVTLGARDLSQEKLGEIDRLISSGIDSAAAPLVTRQTKDLTGLRLIRSAVVKGQRNSSPAPYRIVKHYTVKAGIGAYLPNVTTGFSIEYWLEGDAAPASGTYCISRFAFSLPSLNPHSISFRGLASAGGEAPRSTPLSQFLLRTSDIEGGLNGLRLIDGISNFVIDLRSAKQLNAIGCLPLDSVSENQGNGFIILFFTAADRIFEDDKANTLFLSIR